MVIIIIIIVVVVVVIVFIIIVPLRQNPKFTITASQQITCTHTAHTHTGFRASPPIALSACAQALQS
jgi:preprotein translocase subunit YajC